MTDTVLIELYSGPRDGTMFNLRVPDKNDPPEILEFNDVTYVRGSVCLCKEHSSKWIYLFEGCVI